MTLSKYICAFLFFFTIPLSVGAKSLLPVSVSLMAAADAAVQSTSQTDTKATSPTTNANSPITRTDLVSLTQPAVVRIITRYMGTTTVPSFDIDLNALTWTVKNIPPHDVPYEIAYSGSGFVVSYDGYIVTNSHVVSSVTMRMEAAGEIAKAVLTRKAASMTKADNTRLEALGYTSEQYMKLGADGVMFIFNHFPKIEPNSVTVLKPGMSSEATTISALSTKVQNIIGDELNNQIDAAIRAGVPATVVYKNDKFIDDEKDIAILKVTQTGLPTLNLGDTSAAHEGNPIYVFGFPSSADMNGLFGDPSFTTGAVSAFKDSTQNTFKYIQTDAKISKGSSGGPILNAAGEAIGVVTLQSSNNSGDSFAFGIPIDIVKQQLLNSSITLPTTDGYTSHLLAGLAFKETKHCKLANTEFEAAASANPVFGDVAKFVQPYIDSCTAIIVSGKSIDSQWDEVRSWIDKQGSVFWIIISLGIVLVGTLIAVIFVFARRARKDEVAIQAIEDSRFEARQSPTMPIATNLLTPTTQVLEVEHTQLAPKNPQLISFIEQARASGQTEMQIKAALVNAGWKDALIDENLAQ